MNLVNPRIRAMKSILSHRGYSIAKKGVPSNVLQHYKDELTVMPYVEREEYAYGIKPIKLYSETPKRFYMPRYFGMKVLGEPDKNKIKELEPEKKNLNIIYPPRPHQKPVIEKILKDLHTIGGGVLSAYCSFGKTFASLYIGVQLKTKFMIVCHTTSLMEQWAERINQFIPEAKIGIVQQSTAEVGDVDIIIASLKTLSLKNFDKDFFKSVGLVIWDEIHLMCTNTFSQAFPKCASKYALGLSATPYRKDRCDVIFQYYIGPVLFMLKRKKNDKVVAKCITLLLPEDELNIKYDRRGKIMYTSTLANIMYNPKRTNRIVEMIIDNVKKGRKILVLGEYIKHLKDIMKRLVLREEQEHHAIVCKNMERAREGLDESDAFFPQDVKNIVLQYLKDSFDEYSFTYGLYIGEMNNEERKVSEQKDVILGTYKLASVGMDIPHLDTLIMASPRKDVEQSVGRVMRKESHMPGNKPLIIDIIDNHGMFASQSRFRKKLYKKEGYTIEHIRMEPVSGKITSKIVKKSKPPTEDTKDNKKGSRQPTLDGFAKAVPTVDLNSKGDSRIKFTIKKPKTPKKPSKKKNVDIGDECLLSDSE